MQIYGIDLSKDRFDVKFLDANGKSVNKTVRNNLKDISKFLSRVPAEAVLCAENTGTYGDLLVFLCNQYEIRIALASGYNVKHSLGLVKGKTDPIDATRLREYAERFFDKLSYKTYQSESMSELKQLYSLRSQLVKARKILKAGEHARQQMSMLSIKTYRTFKASLDSLDDEINEVEQEIALIVMSNVD